MKVISDDIKKGEFKSVYLLYGEEEYLKKQYRDRLKNAIVGDDTMNYSYYDSDNASVKDIIDVCETMPFFAQKRLVVMENTGFLKKNWLIILSISLTTLLLLWLRKRLTSVIRCIRQ